MISQKPLVSIVVPTHNRRKMLVRLVKSILKSDYKNIEIIVVDDFSSDGTKDYLQEEIKSTKVTLIRNNRNKFTAATRNVGQKKSKGEFIFFVDDDNEMEKSTISHLVDVMLKNPDAGAVGPVNYSYSAKKNILWLLTKRSMWTSKTTQPRDFKNLRGKKVWESVDIPNAFMVRSSVVTANNIYFREIFEIMYEESDYAYRIKRAGYRILVSKESKIYHDIETREKGKVVKDYMYHFMQNPRRPFVTARNRIIFHSIYSSPAELAIIVMFWMWFFAGYYAYRILFYSGYGSFSMTSRLNLILQYYAGIFAGLEMLSQRKKIL